MDLSVMCDAQLAETETAAAPLFVERKHCPVCGSARLATLFSAPYTGPAVSGFMTSHYRDQGTVHFSLLADIDLTIHECTECTLIFQRMAPEGAMLDILYNRFIAPENLRRFEFEKLTIEKFRDVAIRFADLFERMGKHPRDVRMLDFGFGYGRWARVAVAMGAQVFAVEISPDKKAYAGSIGVTILSEAELRGQQFDLVHTEQVFEHLTDPVGVFDMLAGCVAPGGVMKIAVPVQGRIRQLLKRGFIDFSPATVGYPRKIRDYATMLPLEHVNAFNRRAIERLASRAGFRVSIGSFGGRHLDFDIGSPGAFVRSFRQWVLRAAKDIFVRLGAGRSDCSYYLLTRE